MKVKIIKQYKVREGKFWEPGQVAHVTNGFGRQLIKEGYAHEYRIETRSANGVEFQVDVEVLDNKGTTITKKTKDKSNN